MAVLSGKGATVSIDGVPIGTATSFTVSGSGVERPVFQGAQQRLLESQATVLTPQVLADARDAIDAAHGTFMRSMNAALLSDIDRLNAVLYARYQIASAAKTRSARWKMGPWGSCVRCGGPTRALHLGDSHCHMVCLET